MGTRRYRTSRLGRPSVRCHQAGVFGLFPRPCDHLGMVNNAYGLDEPAVDRIRERDKKCVYCLKVMTEWGSNSPRGDWATIEHLNHLPPWDNYLTVAICCRSCNSSRRDLTHVDWFQRAYCSERAIGFETVAQPVRDYLLEFRPSDFSAKDSRP